MIEGLDIIVRPADLHRLLWADYESGRLFWQKRTADVIHDDRVRNVWNARYAGKEAFTACSRGYRVGRIFDRMYLAHRVIWALANGYWPEGIDHIDRNKSNNRLSNLHEVTHAENMKNLPLARNNSSGVRGVYWNKKLSKWNAKIGVNNKSIDLGLFGTAEEAAQARRKAEVEHGFP